MLRASQNDRNRTRWLEWHPVRVPERLLERYEAGDRVAVWDELRGLGSEVFDPALLGEATAVADATMRRVVTNIQLLAARLTASHYRFSAAYDWNRSRRHAPPEVRNRYDPRTWGGDASWLDGQEVDEHRYQWWPPDSSIEDKLARARRLVGPLPIALDAYWRHVGPVDLSGSFPDWDPPANEFEGLARDVTPRFTDPLESLGVGMVLDYVDDDGNLILSRHGDDRWTVQWAADELTKAGISGGCYEIQVPDLVADPISFGHRHRPGITLVEYLRLTFEWGGFPGFEFNPPVPPEIAMLRTGLLPI